MLHIMNNSEGNNTYGEVQGSTSDWWKCNAKDKGRAHQQHDRSSPLGFGGFKAWETAPPVRDRLGRRHMDEVVSASYAEPSVSGGAHPSYYQRRTGGEADAFRRSSRYMPQTERIERPEGKRFLPEPYGAPPQIRGTRGPPDEMLGREAGTLPEPALPRLGRYSGIDGLRETTMELSFEKAIGRKVRVGQHTYEGSGRAGDLSAVFGAPRRPEDESTFFRVAKDSPTYTRFVSNLPAKPAISPHQRREEGTRRVQQAERERERQMVAALPVPE